jgi:hypothetical protein
MEGLEGAFSWAEFHSEPLTGLAQAVTTYSGGGTYDAGSITWFDRTQNTTAGIGTGASFKIVRSGATNTVTSVVINRPGRNYSDGETVIISSENIGGAVRGASNLSVTVSIVKDGFGNPVSYGTTQTFFDKDFANSNPWSVLRTVQDNSKAYGETYWYFRINSTSNLQIGCSAKYHPFYRKWAGEPGFDGDTSDPVLNTSSNDTITNGLLKTADVSYSNGDQSFPLEISCFRSGLDPNFCIFSFKQPTLASSTLANQTHQSFFLHNYTSNFFDLEQVWMDSFSLVFRNNTTFTGSSNVYTNGQSQQPALKFGVYGGITNNSDHKMSHSRRGAESGYWRSSQVRPWAYYYSAVYPSRTWSPADDNANSDSTSSTLFPNNASQRIYYKSSIFDGTTPDMNFNAVIKGIPIHASYVPCPYYLPDDIVLIDFYYPQSSAFIAQFDTITISPTEVYTVIDGSYNQSGSTRGILLCGRII